MRHLASGAHGVLTSRDERRAAAWAAVALTREGAWREADAGVRQGRARSRPGRCAVRPMPSAARVPMRRRRWIPDRPNRPPSLQRLSPDHRATLCPLHLRPHEQRGVSHRSTLKRFRDDPPRDPTRPGPVPAAVTTRAGSSGRDSMRRCASPCKPQAIVTGILPILACHSFGPVSCTEVPLESTATVTGMSVMSNS